MTDLTETAGESAQQGDSVTLALAQDPADPAAIGLTESQAGRFPGGAIALGVIPPAANGLTLIETQGEQAQAGDTVTLETGGQPADTGGGDTGGGGQDFAPTSRPLALQIASAYTDQPNRPGPGTRSAWGNLDNLRIAPAIAWAEPKPVPGNIASPWASNDPLRRETAVPWDTPQDRPRPQTAIPWAILPRKDLQKTVPWSRRLPEIERSLLLPWDTPPRKGIDTQSGWATPANRFRETRTLPWDTPPRKAQRWRLPWEQARPPEYFIRPPKPEPPPDPEPEPPYTPPSGANLSLDMICPLPITADLFFGRICAPSQADQIRSFFVDNTISVTRTDTGETVEVSQIDLSTDLDSFAWDCRGALLGMPSLQKVQHGTDGPRTLQVTINGNTWTIISEEWDETREFRSTSRTFFGRNRAAFLAAPYSPTGSGEQPNQRTAQQLANEALEFTGWTLLWEIPDWDVPGGVWSWNDQTPIEQVSEIAAAAGAVVQSDPSAQTLRVISRFPASPWNWASVTPDATIPSSVVRSLGSRWSPAPDYNRIFVSGQEQGVLVKGTRDTTAGDKPAPMVTNALITDRLAGRERARVELSKSGNGAEVSIETPIIDPPNGPGVVKPGEIIEFDEGGQLWRGLVTGTDIRARRESVTQTLTVDRRF